MKCARPAVQAMSEVEYDAAYAEAFGRWHAADEAHDGVAAELAKVHPKMRGPEPRLTLVVDHSGVGRPVVDLFRRAGLRPVAITITSGVDAHGSDYDGWRVPLYDLVDGLAIAVRQPATLAIAAALPDLPYLLTEFETFERKLTKAGTNQTFGNFREHSHDDQLFAIAIGLWHAQHGYETSSQKVAWF